MHVKFICGTKIAEDLGCNCNLHRLTASGKTERCFIIEYGVGLGAIEEFGRFLYGFQVLPGDGGSLSGENCFFEGFHWVEVGLGEHCCYGGYC